MQILWSVTVNGSHYYVVSESLFAAVEAARIQFQEEVGAGFKYAIEITEVKRIGRAILAIPKKG